MKTLYVGMQKGFIWMNIGEKKLGGGVSEESNEHSGYTNGRKFLDLLSDY